MRLSRIWRIKQIERTMGELSSGWPKGGCGRIIEMATWIEVNFLFFLQFRTWITCHLTGDCLMTVQLYLHLLLCNIHDCKLRLISFQLFFPFSLASASLACELYIYLAGFLKMLPPNGPFTSNVSKEPIIKTKSTTIAFLSSPLFFLLTLPFYPFLFLH